MRTGRDMGALIPNRRTLRMGRFLWPFVRPWRYRLTLALLALGFVSGASLLFPWLLKVMIDRLTGEGPSEARLDRMALGLVAVLVLSAAGGYFEQVELKRLGYRLRNAVRRSLHSSLISRDMAFHRASRLGELSSCASGDAGRLEDLFSGLIAPAVQNALFIGGCLALMSALNPVATILVVLLVLLPLPVIARLGGKIRSATSRSRAGGARAHALFDESLAAIREVKAFARERREGARYARALEEGLRAEEEGAALQVGINQVVYVLVSGALLAIFFFGTRQSFLPAWSLGDVIAFYFYSYTMTMAVLSAGKVYLSAQETAGAIERIMDICAEGPPPLPRTRGNAAPGDATIELRNVRFSYDGRHNVLDGLSLDIPPGTWLVITGQSGSGKSTLAALLTGLYPPSAGSVRIAGLPPGSREGEALRGAIGYAGQEPVLVHGTLRENIAFRDAPASEEMIGAAVEACCLSSLVRSLPGGLDAHVGERGATLSGGEKSRVAVARAILHDPPVLILDEVNTMLDAVTERSLWENLLRARAERTTIVITHHTDAVPGGDEALVLRGGVIARPAAPRLALAGTR